MRYVIALGLGLALFGCRQNTSSTTDATPSYPYRIVQDSVRGFGFEVNDSAFAKLVNTEATIEVLASGFTWSEGPVWVPGPSPMLLFNDVPHNVTYRYRMGDAYPAGKSATDGIVGVDTFFYPSGYFAEPAIGGEPGANGMLIGEDGKLLLAMHGERAVAKYTGELINSPHDYRSASRKAQFELLTTSAQGNRLNSPNDLIQLENGDILFTDPTYGVDKTFGEEARELDFQGVFRLPAGSDQPTLLLREIPRPNGIVLTPDQRSFIVANSKPGNPSWTICDVPVPGEAALACEDFFDASSLATSANPGNADGMVMHPSGTLFATGPGGVLCFSESGQHLGTIRTGRATANVTLGDGDLYITAKDLLLRVEMR